MKACDDLLCAIALSKVYPAVAPGAPDLELFRDLNLHVAEGEMVAIVGESGAGKSTLLHILAALDTPTAGEVWCGFTHVTALSKAAASVFRNREVGYVWQFHYLLPEFTAQENVALPLLARGIARAEAMQQGAAWLERVGLAGRAANRSGELSGGEQQRVSIARALVTQPKVLLADEPTGDLDGATADRVFALLQQLHREHGLTSVIVTHNTEFARRCDRILRLSNGQLTPL
ncbi:MAG TPA: ABC transporter ATP-binding protein [Acidobacteriaceae bacterium]|jgi:lipoprotein-releasing system ATP-binding protein